MDNQKIRLGCLFFLAFALTIIPLPDWFAFMKPSWVLLLLLYLQFHKPTEFHLSFIILSGFILDVLLSTVMGEHAFALLITTWIASSKMRRFICFPMLQQLILITVFTSIYQLILFLINNAFGYSAPMLPILGSSVSSLLIWPWIEDTSRPIDKVKSYKY